MKPTIQFDLREFERTLKETIETSSRDASAVINSRAYFLAIKAMKFAKRADRKRIEAIGLKTVGTRTSVSKKTGKTRERAILSFEEENAVHNYLGHIKKTGKNPTAHAREFADRKALAKAARKWISSKLKAIGFLASSFLPLTKRFLRYARFGRISKPGDVRRYPAVDSSGTPATKSTLLASLNVVVKDYGRGFGPKARPHVLAALQYGIRSEYAEMKRHLEQKLGEKFKAVSR